MLRRSFAGGLEEFEAREEQVLAFPPSLHT